MASTAGSNQMNPFHYLHLKEPQVDIRGSQIALYARFSVKKKSSVVLAVSLLDGRWKRTVEQPQARIAESLNMPDSRSRLILENPFFVFIIHLTTALEWWINALHSFDEQLIDHEKSLQKQLDRTEGTSSAVYTSINRALHAMSAHLSRFGSELGSTEDTILELMARHRTIFGSSNTANTTDSHSTTTSTTDAACAVAEIENSLAEAKGQAQIAMSMRLELEHKTQNILALLFNRIQLSTDTVLIENGKSMKGIMGALKDEAQASHNLADAQQQMTQDMKEDSVAMKTIAVLTMFFLVSYFCTCSLKKSGRNLWVNGSERQIGIFLGRHPTLRSLRLNNVLTQNCVARHIFCCSPCHAILRDKYMVDTHVKILVVVCIDRSVNRTFHIVLQILEKKSRSKQPKFKGHGSTSSRPT